MKFLKNISIKTRLMTMLFLWIAAFIAFGGFAIKQMNNLGNTSRFIYNSPLQMSNAATEMRVDIIKVQRATRDLLLSRTREEQEKEINTIKMLDESIVDNIKIIESLSTEGPAKELHNDIKNIYFEWDEGREHLIDLSIRGNIDEAAHLSKNEFPKMVDELEIMLKKVSGSSEERAYELVKESISLEKKQNVYLTLSTIGLSLLFLILFLIIFKSIVDPINQLKNTVSESIQTGQLSLVDEEGDNEIAAMSKIYNELARKLKDLFWIKDSKNTLNEILSECRSEEEIAQKTISSLCRTLSAGKGVFYVYDKKSCMLKWMASYAFHKQDKKQEQFALGEGIIGQAGFEKRPILLTEELIGESPIYSAIVSEKPINAYVFPVMYEEELYGVVEISMLTGFDKVKLEYLDEVSSTIAISLYSAMQNAKIIDLLSVSEEARTEVSKKAEELKHVNSVLYNQREMLEQQAEQLRQSNTELEEQHQMLQQQSKELQQTNAQLEEHQQLLEEQTRILNDQNSKLEKTKEELELSGKYKSEFLANMSHELRTPLNSIILLSRLILNNRKEALSAADQEKIEVIHSAGDELLRLINDVLDLSKVESGAVTKENNLFHSSDITQEINNMFKNMAGEKSLKFTVEDFIQQNLYGDKHKISQILRNFVSNAIKFTEKGFIKVELKHDPVMSDGVIFSVQDSGIGILEVQQELIFEQFKQGDNSIARRYGGTGLGLSISKKLAEVMGGEIKVKSKAGEGSEFILCIPSLVRENLQTSHSPIEKTGQKSIKENPDKKVLTEADEGRFQKDILIIEDDEVFAQYIQSIALRMGVEVIAAKDGRSGIEYAKQHKLAGIFLDLKLSDICGMKVLRELKSIRELKQIPIHIISSEDISDKPQKMGAVGYNQKPVEEERIIEVITEMVSSQKDSVKRLLLIEDSKLHEEHIKAILEEIEIEIITASNYDTASKEILSANYDVIILDLELKDELSSKVCKLLDECQINMPVIIYTEGQLSKEQEREIRKCSDRIIVKTAYSDERLLDEVIMLLHQEKEIDKIQIDKTVSVGNEYLLSLDGKRILIVDDDPRNVYSLAAVLEEYNAHIIEADNGKTALRKLDEEKVDLILMDIMMPEMDGYEAIKKIRDNNKYRKIPIIVLTAKSLKGDKDKCIELGANDYIPKPIDYNNLMRVMGAWISKQ